MASLNYIKLDNQIDVDVLDKRGEKINEQTMVNVPWPELFPNRPFTIIDWLSNGPQRPSSGEIEAKLAGRWLGNVAWGSGIKTGKTFGVEFDPAGVSKGYKHAEDGYRTGRAWMAQGMFGGLKVKGLKVYMVPPGTVFPGYGPIEDGSGLALRSFVEAGRDQRTPLIELKWGKDNYTMAHRLPYSPELVADILAHKRDELIRLSDPSYMLADRSYGADYKVALVNAEPEMIRHAFVANQINRSKADTYARAACSINMDGVYRIAVPSTLDVVWPGVVGEQVEIERSPIDSYGSIQTLFLEDSEAYRAEAARIASEEVVQYTLSNVDWHWKGTVRLYDALPVDDAVLVLCSEDLKMCPDDLRAARGLGEIELDEAVLVYLNWWAKGSAIGVNARWGKDRMGLDHDGDGIKASVITHRPALRDAILAMPAGTTPKLKKTFSPLDTRTRMVRNSMANLIGIATNLSSRTRGFQNREMVAAAAGFKTVADMDALLWYFQKVGTDWFKTQVQTRDIEEQVARHLFGAVAGLRRQNVNESAEPLDYLLKVMAVIDDALEKKFGAAPAWMSWPGDLAFTYMAPHVLVETVQGKVGARPDREWWSILEVDDAGKLVCVDREIPKAERKVSLRPVFDGVVPEIARFALPYLKNLIGVPIDVNLLSVYKDWAPPVPSGLVKTADVVQDWWNANQRRTNWSDPQAVNSMKLRYQRVVQKWMADSGLDPQTAAYALWHRAHGTRSDFSGAASVFHAFPEECLEIVKSKPGKHTAKKLVTVVGIERQFPLGFRVNELDVQVVEFKDPKSSRLRKALVAKAPLPGQVQPQAGSYPRNMIGVVDKMSLQPDPGTYRAVVRKATAASWEFTIS